MGYLSLYFDVTSKNVFILGTGEVALRRAAKFLDKGANVKLAGDSLDADILTKGAKLVKIHTDKSGDNHQNSDFFNENKNIVKVEVEKSDIVVIATEDYALADYVSSISHNKLVNRADDPLDGNIIVPTSFYIGDVEFSIYTGGKSPLMAKYLRKKIQNIITDRDILEIELQNYGRELLKNNVKSSKRRREILYELLDNQKIIKLLDEENLSQAKEEVKKYINNL
ncbi:bifunctional precorrin-2 dehydrogenase/sirohydrochlorin ferrochelatase [uncultured Methanobrevibacter sp.]|uniref:precorrin-2 dehydrogenase/sirohydrochlorin ferrochelatase family protein n=1 Tax=uncultured Methanobrevibacter sp. TaxID=253161 RepID=UPI0025F2F3A6|nr:bifunctional precorrin-2 dehydrogenase/sirohydrochlorin ferrochelatase [uncultured Methanobrevibacter sp.]